MRKPGRILLFLSLVSVLIVAGMVLRQRDDGQEAQRLMPAAGTSGMLVAIDPETGTLTQPTPEQVRELEALSATPVAQESGVQTFVLEDGTVGALLDESFDHYSTVHIGADGKLHAACQQGDSSLCLHPHQAGGTTTALPEE